MWSTLYWIFRSAAGRKKELDYQYVDLDLTRGHIYLSGFFDKSLHLHCPSPPSWKRHQPWLEKKPALNWRPFMQWNPWIRAGTNGPQGLCRTRFLHKEAQMSTPAIPAARITALQAVHLWKSHFEEKGVAEPEPSSRYIIAHLLGAKTMESIEQEKLHKVLSQEETEQIWELCARRLSRMPVQYVIGEWDFRDVTLKMRPPVFIPRPETEELVELVLTDLLLKPETGVGADVQQTCLEVGCGSGAISLSLLRSLPKLKAVALDQSQDAVALTRENASRLALQDRLQIHHIDIVKDAETVTSLCSPVSVLVSNPPYLFSEDMATLEPEILRFEDHAALDGGEDGMKVIKQILTLAPRILSDRGRVYLEVDPRHPPVIWQWVEAHVEGLRYVETRHDITGRPRFCILQKREVERGPQAGSGLRS